MSKPTDARVIGAELFLLPVTMRVPLKFGAETVDSIVCARVRIRVRGRDGRTADGWGETPLSVGWVWPGELRFEYRERAMTEFCRLLAGEWARFGEYGHPLEVGLAFQQRRLPELLKEFNAGVPAPMPYLGALVTDSAFDLALADAWGNLHGLPVMRSFTPEFLSHDLGAWLEPDERFRGKYPGDYFVADAPRELPVWHLVGGRDLLTDAELSGLEPADGAPVVLTDWIRRDGLKCLKIKLRGNDAAWDFDRLVAVGRIAAELGVAYLSSDFNCLVTDPDYVNAILDRLLLEEPRIYGMLLYVEQPFPYELEEHRIDVHSVSARKPLFMDESAHDWRLVRLGRELGWSSVALKTCKTLSGAVLALCWAKEFGMTLMVQDLTNPRLAMLPHAQLAAYAGTIYGVECNAPQFYPAESRLEERVYPGLYERRCGVIKIDMLDEPGFGIRPAAVEVALPEPAAREGEL